MKICVQVNQSGTAVSRWPDTSSFIVRDGCGVFCLNAGAAPSLRARTARRALMAKTWLREARRVIRENSNDSDYLAAWPYHPSFNVFTNRRNYEWRMYVDETIAKGDWNARAIARMEERKPRIVVISNWDINGTDASRFKKWGASIYAHIQANYELLGTYDSKEPFEVWKRK